MAPFRRGPILNNYYSEHLTQENGRVLKLPCGEKALVFVAWRVQGNGNFGLEQGTLILNRKGYWKIADMWR